MERASWKQGNSINRKSNIPDHEHHDPIRAPFFTWHKLMGCV